MAEVQLITGLFNDLYSGKSWIDVNIIDTISGLNAQQASASQGSGWNSIWQIINHLISWREHLLENLQGGKRTSPPDNYFRQIDDISEAAWLSTLQKLEASQQDWQKFLQQLQDEALEQNMPGHSFTNYQYIHGIIQHDAYHLGQVAMLAKHV